MLYFSVPSKENLDGGQLFVLMNSGLPLNRFFRFVLHLFAELEGN